MKAKEFLYLLLLFFVTAAVSLIASRPSFAQASFVGTGPGGVGAVDGSGSLELWLQADDEAYTDTVCTAGNEAADGNNVGCWEDKSGNGANVTQATTPQEPTYLGSPAGFNSMPALNFNDAAIENLAFDTTDTTTDMTIFAVPNTNNPGNEYEAFFSSDTTWSTGFFMLDNGGPASGCPNEYRFFGWDLDNFPAFEFAVCAGSNATPAIVEATSNAGTVTTYQNGTLQDTLTPGLGSYVPFFSIYLLGQGPFSGYDSWNGNVAELIVYYTQLSSMERILVENYLSAKYDIAIADDRYDGDLNVNGDFDSNVAGIARISGDLNSEAHSAGLLMLDNTFLADDDDSLLFGHNTALNGNGNSPSIYPNTGAWTTAPDPRYWLRHWHFDRRDAAPTSGGTVDIIFDYSEGGMNAANLPAGPTSNYRLLRRANNGTQYTDITAAAVTTVVTSTDQVQFLGVDVGQLGSEFTLGTLDYGSSPTAVNLSNFQNVKQQLPGIVGIMMLLLITGSVIIRRRRTALK
ncbi:MAG: LamG domain-containing protein [Chloroflexi bacterium]|nr:LamG domain-containing protein [Chloroflexota bacterium]